MIVVDEQMRQCHTLFRSDVDNTGFFGEALAAGEHGVYVSFVNSFSVVRRFEVVIGTEMLASRAFSTGEPEDVACRGASQWEVGGCYDYSSPAAMRASRRSS